MQLNNDITYKHMKNAVELYKMCFLKKVNVKKVVSLLVLKLKDILFQNYKFCFLQFICFNNGYLLLS